MAWESIRTCQPHDIFGKLSLLLFRAQLIISAHILGFPLILKVACMYLSILQIWIFQDTQLYAPRLCTKGQYEWIKPDSATNENVCFRAIDCHFPWFHNLLRSVYLLRQICELDLNWCIQVHLISAFEWYIIHVSSTGRRCAARFSLWSGETYDIFTVYLHRSHGDLLR
jgi:hypothetical protein